MWNDLYLRVGLDSDVSDDPPWMWARAYSDAACIDLVEEMLWRYRPHCGGIGCIADYHYRFLNDASLYFSGRAKAVHLVECDEGLHISRAVKMGAFAQEDENKDDPAHRLLATMGGV